MEIKTLHEKTGKILEAEEKIEMYKRKLTSLRSTQVVRAKLNLEIGYDKRSSIMIWLNTKEVEEILYTRLREVEGELVKLQADFNE